MRSRPTLGDDLGGSHWQVEHKLYTHQGCGINFPTSFCVPVFSGKGVETHRNGLQTSALPPLSQNAKILMLGQKLGMALNELSINPFYIVYYVFIKRKHLASTVI